MSKEQSPPPQGYGHDAKGAAGGKNVPDGRVTVTHSEPVGTVGGKGSGPQTIRFELDGQQVEARVGETIWQVAKRQGRDIPHLCYSPEPDYRPDGNCRACMVEVEGERVLAASCKRTPSVGMKVKTASDRAIAAQKMVMELLVADQPARETSHDPDSKFWHWAEKVEVTESRFPAAERWDTDASHPAMRVNLDACIQCGLCVRACREVQVNDVIGMAYRTTAPRSSSTSTIPWENRPALPAANAFRPARPAR
jgi:formate dehydrogenase major subunit